MCLQLIPYLKIFIHHTMVALYTAEKKMLKTLVNKASMTIKYQLLNGKVIQKTLTSHKLFNKFAFSFHQKFTG